MDKTQWISFSLTIRDYPELIATMEKPTSDYDGCAGLMTFKDSSWCLSTYVQHQPFFPEQPENVQFIWNYGLHPWNIGDYAKKPMSECTGEEILTEMLYHLGLMDKIAEILPHCTVRTAMIAVYRLLHLDRPITPLFQGQYGIRMVNAGMKMMLGKDKIEVSDLPKINPLKINQTLHQIVDGINSIPPVPEYYAERKENQ